MTVKTVSGLVILLSSATVACAQDVSPSEHSGSVRQHRQIASALPKLSSAVYETISVSTEDVYLPRPTVGESESTVSIGLFKRTRSIDIEAKLPRLRELIESQEECTPFFPDGMAFLIISTDEDPDAKKHPVIIVGYRAGEKQRERFLFAAGRSLGLPYVCKSSEFTSSKNREVLRLLNGIEAYRKAQNGDDQNKATPPTTK